MCSELQDKLAGLELTRSQTDATDAHSVGDSALRTNSPNSTASRRSATACEVDGGRA
jgi:hypothetical protein